MVIYANHTLRVAFTAMSKMLNQLIKVQKLEDIKTDMATMEDVFELQQMYDMKKHEKQIEDNLKKLGYIN